MDFPVYPRLSPSIPSLVQQKQTVHNSGNSQVRKERHKQINKEANRQTNKPTVNQTDIKTKYRIKSAKPKTNILSSVTKFEVTKSE